MTYTTGFWQNGIDYRLKQAITDCFVAQGDVPPTVEELYEALKPLVEAYGAYCADEVLVWQGKKEQQP